MTQASVLVDGFGRRHRDLRISLTDHCNLRCTYCMPEDGVPWLPKTTLLTLPELLRFADVAVRTGITEIRLTGGEPLLRRDIVKVVAGLVALEGADGHPEVSMTTNGIGLDRVAGELASAGLSRVNVSLDTLRPDRFVTLSRRGRLPDVLAGLEAARSWFDGPLKLNTVLVRGVNDAEAPDILAFALDLGAEVRFIEQMPLDADHRWTRDQMVSADETQARLEAQYDLRPLPGRGAAPAERYEVRPLGSPDCEPLGVVGIIASVTRPFCGACDRLRLTADGQLRSCLFARSETDVRSMLRGAASDEDLADLIHTCLASKRAGHGINAPGFLQPPRPMSAIGG